MQCPYERVCRLEGSSHKGFIELELMPEHPETLIVEFELIPGHLETLNPKP